MKNRILYFVIIIMACLLAFLAFKYFQKSKQADVLLAEKMQVAKQIKTEAKEISRSIDKNGIESVLYDVTKNVIPDRVRSKIDTRGIIDTTAMALDIQNKQLKQILVVKGTLEAENLKLKQQLDAARRPYYTYSGNGLQLKFTPPNDTDSVATADFTANVGLTATQYWKRSWFLGSKKSILSVKTNSQLFTINGADFVEFEQKQPTFGLRLQANTAYNVEDGVLSYGPAVRFDVGRFSFQGRYSKYPNDPRWKPSINASYDILRF